MPVTTDILSAASDERVLDEGAGPYTEPPGWQDPAFDDTSWPFSVVSVSSPTAISGAQWISFSAANWPATEIMLARRSFDLPPYAVVGATLQVSADATLLECWLNGTALYNSETILWTPPAAPTVLNLDVPLGLLRAGQKNVLGLKVRNDTPVGIGAGPIGVQYDVVISSDSAVAAGPPQGGSPIGTTGPSGVVRVRHANTDLCWEHDALTFRVESDQAVVLQTPFPAISGPPTALLGRDPASGLPAWTASQSAPVLPPPPPPVHQSYHQQDQSFIGTQDPPIPIPVPVNPQRVCGAAYNMSALLCSAYDAIVTVVNAEKNAIIANFTRSLKTEIQAQLVSLLTEGEFAQWDIDAVQIGLDILAAIVRTILDWGTNFPSIVVPNADESGVSIFQIIRCAAWQALWSTGGDYLAESTSADGLGTRDYWQQNMNAQWSFFAGSTLPGISGTNLPWQLRWLDDIVANVPDSAWARAAWIGAQHAQATCTGCAGYPP